MKYRLANTNDIESLYEIESKYFSHPWTKEQFLYESSSVTSFTNCSGGKLIGSLISLSSISKIACS